MRNLDGWFNPHPAVVRATAAKKKEKSVFFRTSITASDYRK
jgi:hypothetical protein